MSCDPTYQVTTTVVNATMDTISTSCLYCNSTDDEVVDSLAPGETRVYLNSSHKIGAEIEACELTGAIRCGNIFLWNEGTLNQACTCDKVSKRAYDCTCTITDNFW